MLWSPIANSHDEWNLLAERVRGSYSPFDWSTSRETSELIPSISNLIWEADLIDPREIKPCHVARYWPDTQKKDKNQTHVAANSKASSNLGREGGRKKGYWHTRNSRAKIVIIVLVYWGWQCPLISLQRSRQINLAWNELFKTNKHRKGRKDFLIQLEQSFHVIHQQGFRRVSWQITSVTSHHSCIVTTSCGGGPWGTWTPNSARRSYLSRRFREFLEVGATRPLCPSVGVVPCYHTMNNLMVCYHIRIIKVK